MPEFSAGFSAKQRAGPLLTCLIAQSSRSRMHFRHVADLPAMTPKAAQATAQHQRRDAGLAGKRAGTPAPQLKTFTDKSSNAGIRNDLLNICGQGSRYAYRSGLPSTGLKKLNPPPISDECVEG
jgi:hypothetical protein